MSSRSKYVSMDKLGRDSEVGSVLLRLMMVINDCAIAAESAEIWRSEESELRRVKREEAFKYFVELQIAHIYEGLKILQEIEDSPRLRKLVDECDRRTREEFDELLAFRRSPEHEKIAGRVRNNLAFHYDPVLVQRTLERVVDDHPGAGGPISMGSKPFDWLFSPGAFVNESVAVREIFKVKKGDDVRLATDDVMLKLQRILNLFMQFSGNFVWHHSKS